MGYFGNFGAGSGTGGVGGFGAGSTPTLWSILSSLIPGASTVGQGAMGMGGDLHSWLSSLMAGAPAPAMQPGSGSQMMFPSNPYTGQSYPPVGASPAVNPPGSMQLNPGGTPATATPVGGQPAAPSVGDMGPNYNWGSLAGGAQHGNSNQIGQQMVMSQPTGLAPSVVQAMMDTLQRGAAYHQMLLGS